MNLNLTMVVTKAGAVPPPAFGGEHGAIYKDADPSSARLTTLVTGTPVDMLRFDGTGSWAEVVAADETSGFCHLSGLIPAQAAHVPWLQIAQREIGVTEAQHNLRVWEYIESVTIPMGKDPDWCACFINWCMRKAKQEYMNHPNSQRWLPWGERRNGSEGAIPDDRRVGDVAIGERISLGSGFGHIAIFLAYDQDTDQLLLLGGNQGKSPLEFGGEKSVRYTWYPRKTTPPQPYGRLRSLHYQRDIDDLAPPSPAAAS